MEQREAREMISTLISSGIPISPRRARKLYEDAGYNVPEHLKEKEYTPEEIKYGRKLFDSVMRKEKST